MLDRVPQGDQPNLGQISPFRLPKALSADHKVHQLFVFAQQSIQAIRAARLGTGKSPLPSV
jgi:hypothetical protein